MPLARIVVVVEFHQPVVAAAAVDIDRSIDRWDRSRLVVALVVVVDNEVEDLRSRDCPDGMRR